MDNLDIAVIGGGPGGYIAAIRAAQLGQKTMLFERRELGGTCLNRGCIPTKALLHTSNLYDQMGKAASLGLRVNGASVDSVRMIQRKDEIVKRLRSGIGILLKDHNVQVVNVGASFQKKSTIIAGGNQYRAKKIIIATGTQPAMLKIPGAEDKLVLNSDDVLALENHPDSVVIIGGGVIGIEFATLYSQLGKRVTIVEMMPEILPGIDSDISKFMASILRERGVTIYTSAKMLEIRGGRTCIFKRNGVVEEVAAEAVIMVAGREPNTADLHLENIGVATDRGYITVDNRMRTNVDDVYAIGDATGLVQLAHVASTQGIIAAHNAAGQNRTMCYQAVPACIYTTPEIATVGLSEQAAAKCGICVKVGRFGVMGNGRSLVIDASMGFAKIVSAEKTGRVIGCQIVSANATEIIAEATIAVANKLTVEQLASTIHAHPTVSEVVMEAALDVNGMSCNKLRTSR